MGVYGKSHIEEQRRVHEELQQVYQGSQDLSLYARSLELSTSACDVGRLLVESSRELAVAQQQLLQHAAYAPLLLVPTLDDDDDTGSGGASMYGHAAAAAAARRRQPSPQPQPILASVHVPWTLSFAAAGGGSMGALSSSSAASAAGSAAGGAGSLWQLSANRGAAAASASSAASATADGAVLRQRFGDLAMPPPVAFSDILSATADHGGSERAQWAHAGSYSVWHAHAVRMARTTEVAASLLDSIYAASKAASERSQARARVVADDAAAQAAAAAKPARGKSAAAGAAAAPKPAAAPKSAAAGAKRARQAESAPASSESTSALHMLAAAAVFKPIADGLVTCNTCKGVASCVRDGDVPKMSESGEFLYKCGDFGCEFRDQLRTRESDTLTVHVDAAGGGGDDQAPVQQPAARARRVRTGRGVA